MVGIDTNVLLRLFLSDDRRQSQQAQASVASALAKGAITINAIVLSEFAWVLSRRLRLSRTKVADMIEGVLESDDLNVMHAAAARDALTCYRKGKADFPDYYLAAINAEVGCTRTLTFDRKALDGEHFAPV